MNNSTNVSRSESNASASVSLNTINITGKDGFIFTTDNNLIRISTIKRVSPSRNGLIYRHYKKVYDDYSHSVIGCDCYYTTDSYAYTDNTTDYFIGAEFIGPTSVIQTLDGDTFDVLQTPRDIALLIKDALTAGGDKGGSDNAIPGV